jgi:hypothetical protein
MSPQFRGWSPMPRPYRGAKTLSIATHTITTISIMTFSRMTFSRMTYNIMTLNSIKGLYATLSISDTQLNSNLLLCRMSLC